MRDAAGACSESRWWDSSPSEGSSSHWSKQWGSSRHSRHRTSHLGTDEKGGCVKDEWILWSQVKWAAGSLVGAYSGPEEAGLSPWPRQCGRQSCWWWGWGANGRWSPLDHGSLPAVDIDSQSISEMHFVDVKPTYSAVRRLHWINSGLFAGQNYRTLMLKAAQEP